MCSTNCALGKIDTAEIGQKCLDNIIKSYVEKITHNKRDNIRAEGGTINVIIYISFNASLDVVGRFFS